MTFSDDELRALKGLATSSDWIRADSLHPLFNRLVASEMCVEATRKWLVNQGPQEDIDLTMIVWRKAAGK